MQEIDVLQEELERHRMRLKDIEPLKARILALEEENRSQRLKRRDAEQKLEKTEKEKEELTVQLSRMKPREQELR